MRIGNGQTYLFEGRSVSTTLLLIIWSLDIRFRTGPLQVILKMLFRLLRLYTFGGIYVGYD